MYADVGEPGVAGIFSHIAGRSHERDRDESAPSETGAIGTLSSSESMCFSGTKPIANFSLLLITNKHRVSFDSLRRLAQ